MMQEGGNAGNEYQLETTAPSAAIIPRPTGDTLIFSTVQPTAQSASAAFIQHVRHTLHRAQEITQVVSEAESVVDDTVKLCEAIKAQHNNHPKKTALTGKSKPVPPLAASLTREIQTSVVWTQTMLEMCSIAESAAHVEPGQQLHFAKHATQPQ